MCKIVNQEFNGKDEKSWFVNMIQRRHNLHVFQRLKGEKKELAWSLSPKGKKGQDAQWKMLP
jgi:hypothetical protein